MAFRSVSFELNSNIIIVADINVYQSYVSHSCCKIHFKLFCRKFTMVSTYSLFWVNFFYISNHDCLNKLSFSMSNCKLCTLHCSINVIHYIQYTIHCAPNVAKNTVQSIMYSLK